jgi:uncharacterized protein DUF6249
MDLEKLVPLMAMAIPILAITGGIIAGIVKTIGQQRLIELAHRERIAAIERGIDPAKLPPLPIADPGSYGAGNGNPRRRAQGLLVGGLVTLAIGIGLSIVFRSVEPSESHWVIGVIPIAVGLALLVSARIVWPPNDAPKP